MKPFFKEVREKLLMDMIKSGDIDHKEIEKEFAEKLEKFGWKRTEYRNFISYGKNGSYINLLGFGFDVQSGIFTTNYTYEELDLNPTWEDGQPKEENAIYIGSSLCDLNAPIISEEEYWKDADGPYTGEYKEEVEEEEESKKLNRKEVIEKLKEKAGWVIDTLKANGFEETVNERLATLEYEDDLMENIVKINMDGNDDVRIIMRGPRFRTECKIDDLHRDEETHTTLFETRKGFTELFEWGISWEEAKEYLEEHGYKMDKAGYVWTKGNYEDESADWTLVVLTPDFIHAVRKGKGQRKWFLKNFEDVYNLDNFFNFDCPCADGYNDRRIRLATPEEAEEINRQNEENDSGDK